MGQGLTLLAAVVLICIGFFAAGYYGAQQDLSLYDSQKEALQYNPRIEDEKNMRLVCMEPSHETQGWVECEEVWIEWRK